jgi:16S rRNA (cytidine1402-2'-O)-methyltransferase
VSGKLYLVATPIGNLGDITIRALEVLKMVDLIAAEDTRRGRKLLNHYEIKGHLISYHSHNERQKTEELLNRVECGENIALITDAGMPCLADPGFFIARAAIERGMEPEIIPGVSASTFAVAAAGVPVDKFYFAGFCSNKSARRQRQLGEYKALGQTIILFESVHRIGKMIADIVLVFGDEQPVIIIREATKVHEERIRMRAGEMVTAFKDRKWKGEFVVVIPRQEKLS